MAAPPHLLGGGAGALRAPHRDCLLSSAVVTVRTPVPCLDVDMEPVLEPPGWFCGLAPGPAGFFLKSFMSLSMLL